MLFSYCIRLFLKTKRLVITYLITFLLISLFLYNQSAWLSTDGFAEVINSCQVLGVWLFLAFAFLSFETVSLSRTVELEESISFYRKTSSVYFYQAAILIVLAFLLSLVQFLFYLWAGDLETALYPSVIWHLFQCAFLNSFMVMVAAISFGGVLAHFCPSVVSYCIIFLVTFFMTPYAESVFTVITTLTPFHAYILKDLLCIIAPNTNAIVDRIYGIPLEAYRWDTLLVWITSLGGTYVLLSTRSIFKPIQRKMIGVAVLLIMMFPLFGVIESGSDSIVQKDSRPYGTCSADYDYYNSYNNPQMKELIQEQQAQFSVSSYQIDLTARRRLECCVKLAIDGDPEEDLYRFTLYHGYNIKAVTDSSGNSLRFNRSSDYLDVCTESPLSELIITYAGSGNQHFSNRQGIALPGYFPYYPIPGHLALWTYPEKQSGTLYSEPERIKVNTDLATTDFKVTVHSDLKIISNLPEVETNVFAGTASSVTLIGGLVDEGTESGIGYVKPVFGTSSLDYFQPHFSEVREKIKLYQELSGEASSIDSFKILLLPNTIHMTAGAQTEDFAYLGDHIVTASYYSDELCRQLDKLISQYQ